MTPLDAVPYLIFLLLLLLAVREIFRGMKHGFMHHYSKRYDAFDAVDDDPSEPVVEKANPISFRLLFVFYCVVVVALPLLSAYAIWFS